jgi:hypothetical protein
MFKRRVLVVLILIGVNSFCQTPKPFQDLNNGKWGLKSKEGNVLISPKYDEFRAFRGSYATVVIDSKKGLVDKKGKEIIPTVYDNISVKNEIIRLTLNRKQGFSKLNKANNKVTPITEIIYDKILVKSDGLFFVMLENKWGVFNKKGGEVVAPKYDKIDSYDKTFIKVTLYLEGNKYKPQLGLINKQGEEVTQIKYSKIDAFSGDFAKVAANGKIGYINKQGKEIITVKYDFIDHFNSKNFVRAQIGDKWGYVNRLGKEVIPIKYDEIKDRNNTDGINYGARLGDKWGFVNLEGVEIVPFIYENIKGKFKEGLVGAKLNDYWGFIDKTGKEIIPFKHYDVSPFNSGRAKVKVLGERGMSTTDFYINKQGEKVE